MQDFSNACRLCLKTDYLAINCLALQELCESVENVFRFKILKEDKYSTKICRECVAKVTTISMYINSVLYNQESLKQLQALHSKILEIPQNIKSEDDDDVIFVSEGQLDKFSPASTSTEADSQLQGPSTQSSVIRKATARKSTSKPPISAPPKKPKLCTKLLKVVCPVLDEKDVGDVYLKKEHRKILKLNGKKRTSSTSNGDTTKLVPPIRLKLSTLIPAKNDSKHQNNDKIPVMKIVNSPEIPVSSVELSPSKKSDDDKSLKQIRHEMSRSLRRSLSTKPVKVVFQGQPDQRSYLPSTSGITKKIITERAKSSENSKINKLPTRQQPPDSTATSPPPASVELSNSTTVKNFDSKIIILKEDKFSKKICRECIKQVTSTSMYINSVLYNQESIKQLQALQSKILEIPHKLKSEDDDDVIFVSEGPHKKCSHASTSTEADSVVEVTSTQSSVMPKAMARKSTEEPLVCDSPKKPKLCEALSKAVCPVLDEKDVGDVCLNEKRPLKLHGKKRTSSTSNKDATELVPAIGLKLSKKDSKNRNDDKVPVMRNVNSPKIPVSSVELFQSDDDKPLSQVRQEMFSKPLRRSLRTIKKKGIFQVQHSRRSLLSTSKKSKDTETKKVPTKEQPPDSTATSAPPASVELANSTSVMYLPSKVSPTSNTKTINSALSFTTPLTVIPTATASSSSNSNFTLPNPRSVTQNCNLDEHIPVESLLQKNTSVAQKTVEDVAINEPKVEVLTANELNTPVKEEEVKDERSTRKQLILISVARVRNEVVIKLSNSRNREVHHSELSESERIAVRNSLMTQESKSKLETATQSLKAGKQTIELLEVLGMDEFLVNINRM